VTVSLRVRDYALYVPVVVSQYADAALVRVRTAVRKIRNNEEGQTPTEYLMIVGLMAAAIVTIFVTFFWTTVRDAASSWATKVKDAVLGTAMN
jgi:Flp pilus assembly pilin Flp